MTAEELRACSAFHCMGALEEVGAVSERQFGPGSCTVHFDETCKWGAELLNENILAREKELNNAEDAEELAKREAVCTESCPMERCEDMCRKRGESMSQDFAIKRLGGVTEATTLYENREFLFDGLGVTTCEVTNLECTLSGTYEGGGLDVGIG